MKLDNLNKWLMLAANFGVIAGIMFLAVEIQQNNELLEAEARINQLNTRNTTVNYIVENPAMTEVMHKLEIGENLTPKEETLLVWFLRDLFNRWEWQYQEYVSGFVQEESLNTDAWDSWLNRSPIIKKVWDGATGVSDEFRQYLEARITER